MTKPVDCDLALTIPGVDVRSNNVSTFSVTYMVHPYTGNVHVRVSTIRRMRIVTSCYKTILCELHKEIQ